MIRSSSSKNLILGCAFNYTGDDILPFLASLQECGYRDDLLLLTNDNSRINLEGYSFLGKIINVEQDLRHVQKKFAPAAAENLKDKQLLDQTLYRLKKEKNISKKMVSFFYHSYFLMTSRYFLYYYYLLQWDYANVFLTDVTDVLFQRNPFEQEFRDGVTAFAEHEGISIKEEPTNRHWILESFGNEVLQAMANEVVYCAGTIFLKNSSKQFLKDFLNIVINHNVSRTIQGVDQGVYNYMISYLKVNYFNRERNGDVVLTVANVPEQIVAVSEKGMSIAGSNFLPAVVHQYTRFERQRKYALQKFQHH